jgi:hypothetical protein
MERPVPGELLLLRLPEFVRNEVEEAACLGRIRDGVFVIVWRDARPLAVLVVAFDGENKVSLLLAVRVKDGDNGEVGEVGRDGLDGGAEAFDEDVEEAAGDAGEVRDLLQRKKRKGKGV